MKAKGILTWFSAGLLVVGASPAPLLAQDAPPPSAADAAAGGGYSDQAYGPEQLDALLAPVALYPDQLLTQILMASTYPLQVVEAERWLQDPANRALSGDALAQVLAAKDWDPSVKSLVPFPQVLAMMNGKLDWMQQVGYAMGDQQSDVWASVQRLREQAQAAGNLQSTDQQTVSTQDSAIVIEPAQPNVVYVPTYNPVSVYGTWAYPAYPPVYLPPPPGYYVGAAIVTGLAFGAAVAINNGLWGWARPHWGYGGTYVNVNRYNTINIHRTQINNYNWRPGGPGYRPGGGGRRPPPGPVGPPRGGVRPGYNGGGVPPLNPNTRPGGNGGGIPPRNPGDRPGANGGGVPPLNPDTRPGANGGGIPPRNPGDRPGANGGGVPPRSPGDRPGANGGGVPPRNPGNRPGANGGGIPPRNPGDRPGANGGGVPPRNPDSRPGTNGGGRPPKEAGGPRDKPTGGSRPSGQPDRQDGGRRNDAKEGGGRKDEGGGGERRKGDGDGGRRSAHDGDKRPG